MTLSILSFELTSSFPFVLSPRFCFPVREHSGRMAPQLLQPAPGYIRQWHDAFCFNGPLCFWGHLLRHYDISIPLVVNKVTWLPYIHLSSAGPPELSLLCTLQAHSSHMLACLPCVPKPPSHPSGPGMHWLALHNTSHFCLPSKCQSSI